MKESGMDKLIELLNEYEKLNMCRKFDSFEFHTFEDSKGLVDRILEDTVISRRYGFIKWLVENDKIDFDKAYNGFITFHFHKGAGYRPDLVLIMILSIQDNPIEFLISVLE